MAFLLWEKAYPVLALEPRIVHDAIEGDEGYPAPMLAVSGLARSTLESYITKTNASLPENAQLFRLSARAAMIRLVIGPTAASEGSDIPETFP